MDTYVRAPPPCRFWTYVETRARSVSFSFASVGCVRRPDGLKTAIASSSS